MTRRVGPIRSLVVMALSFAWVAAGVRNLPRLGHPQMAGVVLVVIVCMWLSFRAGARMVKSEAVATAVAHAEARALAAVQAETTSQAQANVLIVNDVSAGARIRGQALGLQDAPWLDGRHRSIELDETEALDTALEDVLDARELEA